jgi:GNAT superfamily N-acetyltransferase
MPDPHVVSTPQFVSVTQRLDKRIMPAGCAEASCVHGTEWFVNRVFIRPEFRRQGLGRALVLRMLEEVTRQGCKRLVLTPGGYDLPYEAQRDF